MRRAKRWSAVVATMAIAAWGLASPAVGQNLTVVTPETRDSYVSEFYVDPDDPLVVDGVEVMQQEEIEAYRERILASQDAGPAHSEIVPGEMWSDIVGLPEGVPKEEADASEVAIARQESEASLFRTADRCITLWLAPQVCDPILARYEQLGGVTSWLAFPLEPVQSSPDGVGLHQRFAGGYIYWSPETGAHAISYLTAKVWERNGWEMGWLGYPTGGEVALSGSSPIDGELNGWVQQFEGGRIYRSPLLDGFQIAAITGKILERWLAIGGPSSSLGFPVADEAATSDGVGRVSVFQRGSILWHPSFGAWEVDDVMGDVWQMRGGIDSKWGYPVGPPEPMGGGFVASQQQFARGELDLAKEVEEAGGTVIAGKEISTLLIEYLEYQGLSLVEDLVVSRSAAVPGIQSRSVSASLCKNKDSSGPEFGGVGIPAVYDYWACVDKALTPNPDKFSRHDYCTWSPDEFPIPGENAEFSGACALHDMCYEDADRFSRTYHACNDQLGSKMVTVCRANYKTIDPRQSECIQTASIYWFVVTASHVPHDVLVKLP